MAWRPGLQGTAGEATENGIKRSGSGAAADTAADSTLLLKKVIAACLLDPANGTPVDSGGLHRRVRSHLGHALPGPWCIIHSTRPIKIQAQTQVTMPDNLYAALIDNWCMNYRKMDDSSFQGFWASIEIRGSWSRMFYGVPCAFLRPSRIA